ncbi:Magnesium-dependent phosphatase 1 [Porphyridium purpureum]|uniref:Magnesium-dependent phosphatase 1 n=1 Tax=Porphyridium purpureum TaxID=35688 RepID=A0A5J4YXB8_PORPP|nr:Magnesium-dependent phosphatase 1 [Porphyridium purpureum]|eukprot:POR7875..scf209_3
MRRGSFIEAERFARHVDKCGMTDLPLCFGVSGFDQTGSQNRTCSDRGRATRSCSASASRRGNYESRRRTKGAMAAGATRVTVPRLLVFDLDGTLWRPEMYELWGGGAPFKPNKDGNVVDRSGTEVRLLGNSRSLLLELRTDERWKDTQVAVASRTDEPTWAEECMQKIMIADGMNMKSTIDIEEIYKGNKVHHFRALHEKTGIPYDQMIFYDNETANCHDVGTLGVLCIFTPRGMTDGIWQQSLEQFAKAHKFGH